jgi:phosphoglycerate dehydrogenase-like enzyme
MNIIIEETIYSRAPALFDAAAKTHGLGWQLIQPLEEAKALAFHRDADAAGLIIGTKKYSTDFYDSLKEGTLVQRFGVGYGSVPVDLCRERGLPVGFTPGVLNAAVAEQTVTLLLALAKQLGPLDRDMRSGAWVKRAGREVRGKSLALVGFGRIAREAAEIAKSGLGMRILAYDIMPELDPHGAALADEYFTDRDACVTAADFVSLHLPDNEKTYRMVNAEFLKAMKSGAYLINTARGTLVDEAALYAALKDGLIAGAALDVYDVEPYEPEGADQDLRTLENILLTPHCASNTHEANARMAEICIDNCLALKEGREADLTLIP